MKKIIRNLLGKEYIDKEGNKATYGYGDFAILSRKKDYGDKFTNALNLFGIPSTHIGNFNIFDSSVISEVISTCTKNFRFKFEIRSYKFSERSV